MLGVICSKKVLAKILVVMMLCTLFAQIGTVGAAEAEEMGIVAETKVETKTTELGIEAAAESVEPETESLILSAIADSYVNAGKDSASNFGNNALLLVKNKQGDPDRTRQAYIKFDLGGISGHVQSAKLRLFGELADGEGNAVDVQVHQIADYSWQEDMINWNNKPAIGAAIGTIAATKASPAKRWYEVDVSDYMRAQMTNDRIVSLALAQESVNGLIVQFNSKDNSANQPELVIEYEPIVDHDAPVWGAESSVLATPSQNSGFQLEWTPATDNVWVSYYSIYQDGQKIAEVSGGTTTHTVNSLNPLQSYTFKIEAGDPAGNWSNDGPVVMVTVPKTEKFTPIADTFVNGGASSVNNYGSNTELIIKNHYNDANITRQSFMKFDLKTFTEEVGAATLHFYGRVNDGQGSAVDTIVYGMDDYEWDELLVNWDSKPALDHFIKSVPMNSTAKWHQVDVTSFIKSKLAEDEVSIGFAQIKPEGLVVRINSKEHTANQPYLELSTTTLNNNAPNWPAGSELQIANLKETSADLQWNAAESKEEVATYRIYQNGELAAEVSGDTLSTTISGLQLGGHYTFKVEAVNEDNQASHDGPYATVIIPKTELQQTELGNVFTEGMPITFQIPTVREQADWTVRDLNGALISEGTANTVNQKVVIEVPFTKPGYFMLYASVEEQGSETITLQTPFAVLSDYDFLAVDDSPFGVAAHLHRAMYGWSPDLAKLIRLMGAKTARGGMEWNSVEKAPGEYTFTPHPEQFMQKLEEEGINALFVAGYNNPFYDNNGTPYTPAGRKAFANYANAYVGAYEDQLIGMQVYNEFNGGFGKRGNSPANSQPDHYFELLKETYTTIKADHPDFVVSGMVTAGIPGSWMEEVFSLGGLEYLDNVAVHPYRYPQTPEGLDADLKVLQQLIRKHNDGELVPIWISELGWPTHDDASGIDEKSQADYLVRAYVIALSNNVERMIWYDLMNDGMQASVNEHNFGIIRNKLDPLGAYTPKPAYVSYGVMTRELTDAEYVSKDSFNNDIQSYIFERDQEQFRVIWALEDQDVAIATNTPLEITTMTGDVEQFTPHNGKVYLTLTGEPIYVRGNVQQIAADDTFAIEGDEVSPGQAASFTVMINNSEAAALTVDLTVEGKRHTVETEQGKMTFTALEAEGAAADSYRSIVVDVRQGADKIGQLRYHVVAKNMHSVAIRPQLEEKEHTFKQALRIEVDNSSKVNDLTVKKISWSVGDQSGEKDWSSAIKPSASESIVIPLDQLANGKNYPAKITVTFENAETYEYSGNISFNPIYQGTVSMDGKWDKLLDNQAVTVDFSDGNMRLNGYTGVDDISGKLWLNYDKEHFYLTAQITDDIHSASAKGSEIWNNDGLQFSFSNGVPGESRYWYEYGISGTPQEPQVYRWTVPEGKEAGNVVNSKLVITRDEEEKITFYQLALPWSELAPIRAGSGEAMSFSVLLNDNDGNGRKGYIEWGSGIGSEKSPKLFRAMQWMTDTDELVTPKPPVNPGGGSNYQSSFGDLYLPAGAAGEVSLGEKIRLIIPAGATEIAGRITIAEREDKEHLLEQQKLQEQQGGQASSMALLSPIFEVSREPASEWKKLLNLQMFFNASLLSKGQTAVIQRYDVQKKHWVKVEGKIEGDYIGAEIDQLGIYAVFVQNGNEKEENPVIEFQDTDIHWGKPWIDKAIRAGIVVGYTDQTFRPDQAVTRQELIVMLTKVLKPSMSKHNQDPEQDQGMGTGQKQIFNDNKEIGNWAEEAVERAIQAGWISGYSDGSFRPSNGISRAELAAVLTRAAKLGSPAAVNPLSQFGDADQIPGWAKDYVSAVVANGLLKGKGMGKFAPIDIVTRAEAAVIAVKLLEK